MFCVKELSPSEVNYAELMGNYPKASKDLCDSNNVFVVENTDYNVSGFNADVFRKIKCMLSETFSQFDYILCTKPLDDKTVCKYLSEYGVNLSQEQAVNYIDIIEKASRRVEEVDFDVLLKLDEEVDLLSVMCNAHFVCRDFSYKGFADENLMCSAIYNKDIYSEDYINQMVDNYINCGSQFITEDDKIINVPRDICCGSKNDLIKYIAEQININPDELTVQAITDRSFLTPRRQDFSLGANKQVEKNTVSTETKKKAFDIDDYVL